MPLSIDQLTNTTKTSFQPVWLDLNKDLLQDLFIINDHNQGNEYYVQSSLGVFEDLSVECGLFAPASAMSNSWCDFDRDGDFDVYITNTIQGNRLLVNNGQNVFTDEAVAEGLVLNAWTWSATWLDAENDGWEDLYVASKDLVNDLPSDNYYFRNNQGTFVTPANNGLSGLAYGGYASAKGDFNNDGMVDLALTTEQNEKYKLFQNTTATTNKYFKFRLKGRFSNRNGIGTRYDYWVGGEKRTGYTYCGEGYLTQNSQNILLGLGNANSIDSLKLYWLSGVEDVHYNLSANSFHVFVEGEAKTIVLSPRNEICDSGDSIQLTIQGWPVVMWDNGSYNPSRTVTAAGTYSAIVSTGFGHSVTITKTIDQYLIPAVTITSNDPTCFNASNGSIQAEWNVDTIAFSSEYGSLTAGGYAIPITYGQGCLTQELVTLNNPEVLITEPSVSDASCFGSNDGSIVFSVNGGTPPYNFGNGLINNLSNLVAGDYSGILLDANGCEAAWSATVNQPSPLIITANSEMPSVLNDGSIVLSVSGGIEPYSFEWSNGNQLPENINLQAGEYTAVITDNNGCSADTTISLIFNYVQPLNLNAMIWTLHKDGLHYDGSETLHHVFVYDAVGRLLHREQIMAGHTTIPMDASGPLFILSHEGNWKSSISLE
jgi:hypothetical protein